VLNLSFCIKIYRLNPLFCSCSWIGSIEISSFSATFSSRWKNFSIETESLLGRDEKMIIFGLNYKKFSNDGTYIYNNQGNINATIGQ